MSSPEFCGVLQSQESGIVTEGSAGVRARRASVGVVKVTNGGRRGSGGDIGSGGACGAIGRLPVTLTDAVGDTGMMPQCSYVYHHKGDIGELGRGHADDVARARPASTGCILANMTATAAAALPPVMVVAAAVAGGQWLAADSHGCDDNGGAAAVGGSAAMGLANAADTTSPSTRRSLELDPRAGTAVIVEDARCVDVAAATRVSLEGAVHGT